MQKLIALAIADLLCATVTAAGSVFVLSPLWRAQPEAWVPVASVDALPADGEPRRVMVSLPDVDAWARRPDRPVYQVFLRRDVESGDIVALSSVTRYGVALDYDPAAREFHERCWRFRFDLNGKCVDPNPHSDLVRVPARVTGGQVYLPASPPVVRGRDEAEQLEDGRQR